MSAMPIRGTRCVQSRFFLADLRDAFVMLAFFLSVVRFLEATFFATFFFVRDLGFFAPIAVATLSQTTPGTAVAVAAAVAERHGQTRQLEFWSLRRRFCRRPQEFLAHSF